MTRWTAEEQVADEVKRKSRNPVGSRQTISDSQAAPAFDENRKRLKAERQAREASEPSVPKKSTKAKSK